MSRALCCPTSTCLSLSSSVLGGSGEEQNIKEARCDLVPRCFTWKGIPQSIVGRSYVCSAELYQFSAPRCFALPPNPGQWACLRQMRARRARGDEEGPPPRQSPFLRGKFHLCIKTDSKLNI